MEVLNRVRRTVSWLPLVAVVGITGMGTLQAGAEAPPPAAAPAEGLASQADALQCRVDDLVAIETIDYLHGTRGWPSAAAALGGAIRARVVPVESEGARVLRSTPQRVSWVTADDAGQPVAVTATNHGHSWLVTNVVSCQRPITEGVGR